MGNEQSTYRIIFKGEIVEGETVDEVKKRLSTVFKIHPNKVDKLFSGKPSVLVKDANRETCEKVRKVGDKCGAVFYIEPQKSPIKATPEPERIDTPTERTPPQPEASKPADELKDERPQAGKEVEKPVLGSILNFRIIEENQCPLYHIDDEFQLSGTILSCPKDKPTCTVLVEDVLTFSVKYRNPDKAEEQTPENTLPCSGCQGTIRLECTDAPPSRTEEDENYIGIIAGLLNNVPIYQSVESHLIREFSMLLRPSQFGKGEVIIRKGEQGSNLYILVSGRVEVLGEGDMSIAFMDKGEVFGEMSLLSGSMVGATIKAIQNSTVLYMTAMDFRRFLSKSNSLQMYFNRLLIRRMTEINLARSELFSSGITGKLIEIPPSELFQFLYINQKTGILTLELSRYSSAQVLFREGGMIRVRYGDMENEEAFFELLKIRKGRFRFTPGLPPGEMETPELGDFMQLLMEGLRRIDEADKRFLKTMLPV